MLNGDDEKVSKSNQRKKQTNKNQASKQYTKLNVPYTVLVIHNFTMTILSFSLLLFLLLLLIVVDPAIGQDDGDNVVRRWALTGKTC